MATLVASREFSIAPWLNTGEIAPVTTPRPTCIGLTLVPPTVWLTRSAKLTELVLKPTVLMFARLLPMTLRYVELALRPDRPAENDPTAMMCSPEACDARGRAVWRASCRSAACCAVPASVAKAAASSLIDVSIAVSFSSELNCASCARNSPSSCGSSGSWLASCVVSSFRNASCPSVGSRGRAVECPTSASFGDA